MAVEGNQPTGQAGGSDEDVGTIQIPNEQVHPALANSPHPDMAQVHNVKVNGREEQWTTAQLIEKAQKGQAAEEKFQEAAQERKGNARATAIEEDLQIVIDGGEDAADAFRRIGEAYKVPADHMEKLVAQSFGGNEESDEDVVDQYSREIQGTRSRDGDKEVVSYDRLSPDVQRALRKVEQGRMEEIVRKTLDKDENLSYNIGQHTPEGQRAIRQYVDEKIRGRLAAYGGDFGDGSRILAEVLPEVREHLQALGTPGTRGSMGLGPSPGGGDTEVYPKQKPDHVSSTEGDAYEQNILETMAYHQARAEQGRS